MGKNVDLSNKSRAYQNWTVEDWKNVTWSDESRFLLRNSDGRVRIWRKQHENMDPSGTVKAGGGGVMEWGMFSWHTLDPLVPIGHHLNAMDKMFLTISIPLSTPCTHPLMATSSRIMHHVTKYK